MENKIPTIAEEFKDIDGYEGSYQISNLGRIKSLIRKGVTKETILISSISTHGYYQITLSLKKKSKTFRIHRLIAKSFIPNIMNKREINHIDGNKLNNHVSNLEWCTRSENISHAFKTGLSKISTAQKESIANNMRKRIGDKNPKSKKVIDLATGIIYGSAVDAAKIFNIKPSTLISRLNGTNSNNTTLRYYNPLDNIK